MPDITVGDDVWWRGMRMLVTEVSNGKFRYQSKEARVNVRGTDRPPYICASTIAEAKWDEDLRHWYLPGVTGVLPKLRRKDDGSVDVVDPPLPTCTCDKLGHGHDGGACGAVTHRRGPLCTSCRIANAKEAI